MNDRVLPEPLAGVVIRRLLMHPDERGSVCELFRDDWAPSIEAVQWHALTSRAGTLRGMHLHVLHADCKIVVSGREALMLKDLRRGSPTEGDAARLELSAAELTSVIVPPGVAHGIYSYDDSVTIVGATTLYDPGDEYEFSWADPELGAEWPAEPTTVSVRDRNAQPLRSLVEQIEQYRRSGGKTPKTPGSPTIERISEWPPKRSARTVRVARGQAGPGHLAAETCTGHHLTDVETPPKPRRSRRRRAAHRNRPSVAADGR